VDRESGASRAGRSLIQAPSSSAPPAGTPPVVSLEGGQVTLIPLNELVNRRQAVAEEVNGLRASAEVALEYSRNHFADAGRLLVERRTAWTSAPVAALLDRSTALTVQITTDHQRLVDDHASTGQLLSDLWKRVKTLKERGDLSKDEAAATAELRGILIEIAETPTAAELPEAKPLREEGAAVYAQSSSLALAAKAKAEELAQLTEEVGRRNAAVEAVGFDSLYLAAWLETNGPTPIETTLVLKKGEQAYLNTAATLARHGRKMEWVGGSQGFSFPIAQTGIRYRVGSYRGHPVQHEVLNRVDSGDLVLTSQRLAFMGKVKLVSIPLDKIANLETYTDGVSVFQENKENPNVFLVSQVNYLVFYLNYLLGRR
jgi:hypothetical protein